MKSSGYIKPLEAYAGEKTFADPAFMNNKTEPVHRWSPWVAGFSKFFVNDALNNYTTKGDLVLDPFTGVGTTLLESLLHDRNTMGFEINHYAKFSTEVKLKCLDYDVDSLERALDRFDQFMKEKIEGTAEPIATPPPGFRSKIAFYSPNVLRQVLFVLDYINEIDTEDVRNFFKVAFASTMVNYSNYSYEPSLGTRRGSGKKDITDYDVKGAISNKISEMIKDVKIVQKKHPQPHMEHTVFHDSFFNYAKYLEEFTVDLIITSPPYLNNYHYNRNTRPQLFWLDLITSTKELKELEESNFGTYWQTARDYDLIELNRCPPNSDLQSVIDEIRSKNPEKGTYGGNGWANYCATYFNDCYKFAEGIHYSLKEGKTALVVIGNSIVQGVPVATDQFFAEICEDVGLHLEDIHIPRTARVGNSITSSGPRMKSKTKQNLYEAIVEITN